MLLFKVETELGISKEEALKMPRAKLQALLFIHETVREEQQRLISKRAAKNTGIS
jgi:hypothetical protein